MTYLSSMGCTASPFVCLTTQEVRMIVWGEEGDLDSFSPDLDSSGKMRSVLKPHAKTKLSHLSTCGFRLKPKYFYSESTLIQWLLSSLLILYKSRSVRAHHPPPPSEMGKLSLPRADSNGWKREGHSHSGRNSQFSAALVVDTGP